MTVQKELQKFADEDRHAVFISQDSGDIFLILPEGFETCPFDVPIHAACHVETASVAVLINRLDFQAYDEDNPPGIVEIDQRSR